METLLVLLVVGFHRVTGDTEIHLIGIGEEGIHATECDETQQKDPRHNGELLFRNTDLTNQCFHYFCDQLKAPALGAHSEPLREYIA